MLLHQLVLLLLVTKMLLVTKSSAREAHLDVHRYYVRPNSNQVSSSTSYSKQVKSRKGEEAEDSPCSGLTSPTGAVGAASLFSSDIVLVFFFVLFSGTVERLV